MMGTLFTTVSVSVSLLCEHVKMYTVCDIIIYEVDNTIIMMMVIRVLLLCFNIITRTSAVRAGGNVIHCTVHNCILYNILLEEPGLLELVGTDQCII